jgi:hypothetical protein
MQASAATLTTDTTGADSVAHFMMYAIRNHIVSVCQYQYLAVNGYLFDHYI